MSGTDNFFRHGLDGSNAADDSKAEFGEIERNRTVLADSESAPLTDVEPRQPYNKPNSNKLGLAAIVALIFFSVAGGPYGTEGLVRHGGGMGAILAILVVPWIWGFPAGMVTTELATAMPYVGGYTVWVHEAFGPFWAFQEGWWKWAGGAIDSALYPVLMMDYFVMATGLRPGNLVSWLCKAFVATVLTAVNLSGLNIVGTTAIVVNVLVLLPFAFLLLIGADKMEPSHWGEGASSMQLGPLLHNALWNFSGFDNISTLAGAVDNPAKTLPTGMVVATVMIMLNYLIPVMTAVALDPNFGEYHLGRYCFIAGQTAGEWLLAIFFASATLSGVGMYLSELASDSYNLLAMGENGLLPRFFASKTRGAETPWVAILGSYIVVMVLISVPFGPILEMDNLLYCAALLLEYAAFVQLKRTKPDMPRPFAVPGGVVGACALVVPSFIIGIIAIWLCSLLTQLLGLLVIAFGMCMYFALCRAKTNNWLRFNIYKASADRAEREDPDDLS